MVISEINGKPATAHLAARVSVDERFVVTAMGLQARTEQLKPRGYGSLIRLASALRRQLMEEVPWLSKFVLKTT